MQTKRSNVIKRIQGLGISIPENYCYSEDKNKKSIDRQFEQALVKGFASIKEENKVEQNVQTLKTLLDFLVQEVIPFQDPPRLKLVISNTLQSMSTSHEKNWDESLALILWDFCETHPGFFEVKLIEQFIQRAAAHQDPDLLQRMGFYLYHQNAESKLPNKDKNQQALLCLVLGGQNNLKVHCYEHLIDVPTDLNLSSLAALVQKLEKHKQTALYFKILQSSVITSLEQQARINVHAANELSEIFYHAWLLSENESQENITYYFIQTLSYARHAMRTNDQNVVQSVVDRVVKIHELLHPEELEDPLADTIVKASQECFVTLNNMIPSVRALHSFYFGPKDKKEEYEITYMRARELESKQISDRKVDDEIKVNEAALEESKVISQSPDEKAIEMSTRIDQCQMELRIQRTKAALFDCVSDSKNPSKVENGFWGIYTLWDHLELQPYEISIFADLLREQFNKEQKDNLPFTPTLAVLFANIPVIKNKIPENIFNNIMQRGLDHFDELTVDEKNKVATWEEMRLSREDAHRKAVRDQSIKKSLKYFFTTVVFPIGSYFLISSGRNYYCGDKNLMTVHSGEVNNNPSYKPICSFSVNKIIHPEFYKYLPYCLRGEMNECAKAEQYARQSIFASSLLNEVQQQIDLGKYTKLQVEFTRAAYYNNIGELNRLHAIDPKILQNTKGLLSITAKNPNAAPTIEFLCHNHYPDNYDVPFIEALDANNTAVAKVLLEHGASLEPKNSKTPLFLAISNQNVELLKLIITYNPNLAKKMLTEHPYSFRETLLKDSSEIFKILFESGVVSEDVREDSIHFITAMSRKNWHIVEFLFNKSKNHNGYIRELGHYANRLHEDDIVKILNIAFNYGFQFNDIIDCKHLLDIASTKHKLKLLELLLTKGKILSESVDTSRAIILACNAVHWSLENAVFVNGQPSAISTDVLELVLKLIGHRKDFETIIEWLDRPKPVSIPVRYFALLINAGYADYSFQNQKRNPIQNGDFSEDFIIKSVEELRKIDKIPATHSKIEPRTKGLQNVLTYSVNNGYKSAVREVLKTNLMDYNTVKQAALQAHKIKNAGIYNLLRNHMRSMTASVVPQHYTFYQPAPAHSQPLFSKESGHRRRAHR